MPADIALAQGDFLVGDIDGNVRQVLDIAAKARDELGAAAVIFPELCICGYPPEDLLLRPEFLADVEAGLARICKQTEGIDLVIGYPRRKEGKLYNAAGVIRRGAVIAEYFKAELPNYSVFDEKRYFMPGEAPCVVTIAGVPMGITICEDIWKPRPAAQAAAAGALMILNLNASPYQAGKGKEREQVVSQRARGNGLPVVYVNLVGGQDELVFDGASFVVDAGGKTLLRSAFFKPSLEVLSLEGGQPQPGVVTPCPDEEEMIYRALVLGVRDYVSKTGFKGVVLGLSGGIDSALTLAVAVDALGPEQVEVVLMPSRYTADMSNEDALEQARRMGVKHSIIPIEPAFKAFLGMLEEEFAGQPMDVTEENIQARCRGIILMAISNKSGRMLLTTGNKSEMSVGYATLYGDMAGGFAPLKDVFKTMVYRLSRWRNRDGEVIRERVIVRPPSAELRPDQQDTDSLPPYDVLDEILSRYVEQDQGVAEIVAAGFDQALVRRITRMVDINEYKRRQAPPGVKVTRRAYGRDRRYPIVNGY
ncbi:NAD+ synthase [Thiolapillus sp.]|uniref:NAD+ synthase n=1 Tax=Thiolapillus sp. TaxID=2017437 RepID=UPI0025D3F299|nr:NAD+ synthase [Thiolapillus sp.]